MPDNRLKDSYKLLSRYGDQILDNVTGVGIYDFTEHNLLHDIEIEEDEVSGVSVFYIILSINGQRQRIATIYESQGQEYDSEVLAMTIADMIEFYPTFLFDIYSTLGNSDPDQNRLFFAAYILDSILAVIKNWIPRDKHKDFFSLVEPLITALGSDIDLESIETEVTEPEKKPAAETEPESTNAIIPAIIIEEVTDSDEIMSIKKIVGKLSGNLNEAGIEDNDEEAVSYSEDNDE